MNPFDDREIGLPVSAGPYLSKTFLGVSLLLVFALTGRGNSDTDLATAKYGKKFAEVLGDGLVVGYCSGTSFAGRDVGAWDRAQVALGFDDSGLLKTANLFRCGTGILHKGEMVTIERVRTAKHGQTVILEVANVPHSITRGIGAFEHQSVETGRVQLVFTSNVNVDTLIAHWLKISDTAQINELSNTASMVVVKQVKLGMSFVEVEQALGVPQTRVDLASRVLYKYKDMTVEFHDGKVTDVR